MGCGYSQRYEIGVIYGFNKHIKIPGQYTALFMKNTKNPQQFSIFQSNSLDPCLNLAIEEYLFTHSKPGDHIIFFYRNSPCVVIGRFQIPWNEFRPSYLKKKSIPFLRRISGGGAVYHDLGNLNFSIITDQSSLSREEYIHQIRQGLSSLGVKSICENNNSLTVDGYKVSGSAYRITKNRVLYHGTMLVNTHLRMLRQCLTPGFETNPPAFAATPGSKTGVCTGGVASRRYNVINLVQVVPGITMHTVMVTLAGCFSQINDIHLENVPENTDWNSIHTLAEKNKSFEWLYGQTPACEIYMHLTGKKLNNECCISINKGRIRKIDIPGFTQLSVELTELVKTMPFASVDLLEKVQRIQKKGKEQNIVLALSRKISTLI